MVVVISGFGGAFGDIFDSFGASFTGHTVPEPSTFTLAIGAAIGVVLFTYNAASEK